MNGALIFSKSSERTTFNFKCKHSPVDLRGFWVTSQPMCSINKTKNLHAYDKMAETRQI